MMFDNKKNFYEEFTWGLGNQINGIELIDALSNAEMCGYCIAYIRGTYPDDAKGDQEALIKRIRLDQKDFLEGR